MYLSQKVNLGTINHNLSVSNCCKLQLQLFKKEKKTLPFVLSYSDAWNMWTQQAAFPPLLAFLFGLFKHFQFIQSLSDLDAVATNQMLQSQRCGNSSKRYMTTPTPWLTTPEARSLGNVAANFFSNVDIYATTIFQNLGHAVMQGSCDFRNFHPCFMHTKMQMDHTPHTSYRT